MSDDLASRKYIRFDADGVTKVPETEAADIEVLKKMFGALIKHDFDAHGHSYATTHARTHGIIKGTLKVPDNLPQHLKQGLFSHPGDYPVVLRYSNQSHDVNASDNTPMFRGCSIKIFNVDGERLPDGQDLRTQDFLFNSSSSESDLSDAKTTREIIDIRLNGIANLPDMIAKLKARPDAELQLRAGKAPMSPIESLPMYSQTAFRFGDYVAKHSLAPSTETQQKLADKKMSTGDPPNTIGVWLQDFFKNNDAEYDWKFQLCENLAEQSVEFSGTTWDPTKYPYQTVAKLVFPKQDPANQELKTFWEDNMRINMWRGLKTFEPLGGTNRVRRQLYPFSGQMREQLNDRKIIEVQKIGDLPGPLPPGVPN